MNRRRFLLVVSTATLGSITAGIFWSRRTPTRSGNRLAEQLQGFFDKQVVPRISFPRVYDGHASSDLPPDKQKNILAIHRRFWHNYSQIDQVSFRYSFHTFDNSNRPRPTGWGMDAVVSMRYGHGIELEGTDENGKPFRESVTAGGLQSNRTEHRDVSSIVRGIFHVYDAMPARCQVFLDVQEDVQLDSASPECRYDVLYSSIKSEYTSAIVQSKYWFNHRTGMLERTEICDPFVKAKYGRYSGDTLSYVRCDGVYLPSRIVDDYPGNNAKTIETYKDFRLTKVRS
jgi:hypothetical protein